MGKKIILKRESNLREQDTFIKKAAHILEESCKDKHLSESELRDKALELAFLSII